MYYLLFYPEDERRAGFCGTSKFWSWICVHVYLSVAMYKYFYLFVCIQTCKCIYIQSFVPAPYVQRGKYMGMQENSTSLDFLEQKGNVTSVERRIQAKKIFKKPKLHCLHKLFTIRDNE